jgi:hypothetical protein
VLGNIVGGTVGMAAAAGVSGTPPSGNSLVAAGIGAAASPVAGSFVVGSGPIMTGMFGDFMGNMMGIIVTAPPPPPPH